MALLAIVGIWMTCGPAESTTASEDSLSAIARNITEKLPYEKRVGQCIIVG